MCCLDKRVKTQKFIHAVTFRLNNIWPMIWHEGIECASIIQCIKQDITWLWIHITWPWIHMWLWVHKNRFCLIMDWMIRYQGSSALIILTSFDPGQRGRIAQADPSRYFLQMHYAPEQRHESWGTKIISHSEYRPMTTNIAQISLCGLRIWSVSNLFFRRCIKPPFSQNKVHIIHVVLKVKVYSMNCIRHGMILFNS